MKQDLILKKRLLQHQSLDLGYKIEKMILRQHALFIFLLIPAALNAQHKTVHDNLLWVGYYNTIQLNNHLSIVSDAQLRSRDWVKQWSQILVRSGLSYSFDNNFVITGGMAFFKNAQYLNTLLFLKNEWRPWQEISYQIKSRKTDLTQRLRTEQRFLQQVLNNKLTDRYEYIFRLRYRIEWQLPLSEDFKFGLGNEVLVNPRYLQNNRFFDQNRTFAGISFTVSPSTSLQFQYLKIFQWRSNLSELEKQDILRLNLNQKINLKNNS